jgi:hypothetical protein
LPTTYTTLWPADPAKARNAPNNPWYSGAGDRRGYPVAAGILHAQHVEEIPGDHELDGSVVAVEVLDQQGELRGRLEDVAARGPSDMGVGQEHEQRVVRELVPDDAIGGGPAQHTRPAAPAPFPIVIIPGAMRR